MKRADRLNAVIEMLAESGQVEVDEIVMKLEVSPATARRDLDSLAGQKLLTRTHGGAIQQSVAYDLPLRYKKDQHATEKQLIARAASALVPQGAVVGLCGGTTSTAIANELGARADVMKAGPYPNLTVVTNTLDIAVQLVMRPQIKVVVTGGVVQPRSYELVGPFSDAVLDQITLDFAFIGVNGMDPVIGGTVHDEAEASVNALMGARASQAVIVADSSKIGRRAFATLNGGVKIFNTLITDAGITDEQRSEFVDHGITVIVA